MKKASLIIEEIKNHHYQQMLTDLYLDQQQILHQENRYIQALEKFIDLYGDKEVTVYSTPGRSEVCGNHTDHQHGEVLAAAINLDVIAVVAKDENQIKVLSDDYDIRSIDIHDTKLREDEKESSEGLIRGILSRFEQLDYHIGGFVGYMTSDVLQGSGLSSSAAFEVMIGTILSGMYNDMKIDPVTIAKIGQYSENVYFGKPCGLMDQCACSVGSLVHIDFKDQENPIVEKVNVDFSQFGHSLCIVDVHASHADLTQDYADITEELKAVDRFFDQEFLRDVDEKEFYKHLSEIREAVNDRAVLRAIHVFNENRRVQKAVQALNDDCFDTFKQTIKASGESSFKYLQNVYSNHYVGQQAVAIALALSEDILGSHGVCRVHGGGFAGTIQAFVEDDFVSEYKAEIEKYFGDESCHILKIRKYGGTKVID